MKLYWSYITNSYLPVLIILFCNYLNAQETVTDIDGNVYHTVTIGSQTWMVENLKTTRYRNGDPIGTTSPAWRDIRNEDAPKYQWILENDASHLSAYGRLYTWYAVTDSRNITPEGWHVPTDAEWNTLITFLGGDSLAGGKLKDTATIHWKSPNTGATNESGFTAIPGGDRFADGTFDGGGAYTGDKHHYGFWWSKSNSNNGSFIFIDYQNKSLKNSDWSIFYHTVDTTYGKKFGFSVRCIKDTPIDYLGQTPPGDSAIIFAPQIVSLPNRDDSKIVFSPDGNECYYNAFTHGDTKSFVYYTTKKNNTWTDPQIAPFSLNYNVTVDFFSEDGNKIYLTLDDNSKYDLGFVERTIEGWSDPQILPNPISTSSREMGYTQTFDGTIYFDSDRNGGRGETDIWCFHPSSNLAENLGNIINSTTADFHPCIAPDGSYLIFSSWRSGGYTEQDLFISFRKMNNEWTVPVSMERTGAKINVQGFWNLCPSISPDGKYLFYCHHTSSESRDKIDIYWVSTHVVVGLKKIAFAPKLNRQIPVMNITSDSTLTYIIPSNIFSCEYGVENLSYSAALSDGSALPSWLTFNPATRTISGKPIQDGVTNIKITVTNSDSVSASCTFRISVKNPTGINKDNKKVPDRFMLNQNYPNPFNPSTKISYQLAEESKVKLTVYNTLGQQIKILIDSFQNAGEYSLVWDATDNNSIPVCSGVYFYRIETDDFNSQKKMILAR